MNYFIAHPDEIKEAIDILKERVKINLLDEDIPTENDNTIEKIAVAYLNNYLHYNELGDPELLEWFYFDNPEMYDDLNLSASEIKKILIDRLMELRIVEEGTSIVLDSVLIRKRDTVGKFRIETQEKK